MDCSDDAVAGDVGFVDAQDLPLSVDMNALSPEPESIGAYLDTNVLRDFLDGSSDPRPPHQRPGASVATARAQLAAVRLVLYAPNRAWDLWVSEEGRTELRAYGDEHGQGDWTDSLFEDADRVGDAVSDEQVRDRARRYLEQLHLGGRHARDMEHLARAALTSWISVFVTNDSQLRRRAARLDDPTVHQLQVLSALEAEGALAIRPGEQPARGFRPTHPLAAAQRWWKPEIPSSMADIRHE